MFRHISPLSPRWSPQDCGVFFAPASIVRRPAAGALVVAERLIPRQSLHALRAGNNDARCSTVGAEGMQHGLALPQLISAQSFGAVGSRLGRFGGAIGSRSRSCSALRLSQPPVSRLLVLAMLDWRTNRHRCPAKR